MLTIKKETKHVTLVTIVMEGSNLYVTGIVMILVKVAVLCEKSMLIRLKPKRGLTTPKSSS